MTSEPTLDAIALLPLIGMIKKTFFFPVDISKECLPLVENLCHKQLHGLLGSPTHLFLLHLLLDPPSWPSLYHWHISPTFIGRSVTKQPTVFQEHSLAQWLASRNNGLTEQEKSSSGPGRTPEMGERLKAS